LKYFITVIDLGVMKPFNKFRYFLCLVDVYSWHLYAIALRTKSAKVVGRAFEHLFNEIQSPITKIQTDSGILKYNYT